VLILTPRTALNLSGFIRPKTDEFIHFVRFYCSTAPSYLFKTKQLIVVSDHTLQKNDYLKYCLSTTYFNNIYSTHQPHIKTFLHKQGDSFLNRPVYLAED